MNIKGLSGVKAIKMRKQNFSWKKDTYVIPIERCCIQPRHIQGADFKLSRLSDRYIYPCNGRTRPGKVSLEPHESKEDFDMSRAKIGHSKLSQEQIDRRVANLIRAAHFLAILTIFEGPKSRGNETFFPSQLFFSILLDMEMTMEKRNGV